MTNAATQSKTGRILCRILRVLTGVFILLGAVSILLAAVAKTDRDLTDIGFYLTEVFVINSTIYFSGITFLWNLSRLVGYQTGMPMREGRFERVTHTALLIVVALGLVALFYALLLMDVTPLMGVLMLMIHYAAGGLQLLLYAALWIRAILRRIGDRRRAEAERLEEERLAWEGYLS